MTIGKWEIQERATPPPASRCDFSSPDWALFWLLQFRNQETVMSALRASLARRGSLPLTLMDDHEILRQLANEISRGDLYVVQEPWKLQGTGGGSEASQTSESSQPAPPPPPSLRSVREPELEEPAFPPDADLIAIAAAQKEAAQLGIPFCEECAKALAKANA